MKHLSKEEIEANLNEVLVSPKDGGTVDLIVRRPREDERETLAVGRFDVERGLDGDCWAGSGRSVESQITLMNSRFAGLIAIEAERRALAGDQLFVDLDLSESNIKPGTRLAIGSAILETTGKPHNGCRKFVERFGLDAMLLANSPRGKELHLRGIYAKVVVSGTVAVGDTVRKAPVFKGELVQRFADFLIGIGIDIKPGKVDAESFLPGIEVFEGGLVVDESALLYPGDILHEAGHLAVAPASVRPRLSDKIEVPGFDADGLEVESILWSYAACVQLGIDPRVVFHEDGYKGRASGLLMSFAVGVFIGLNRLEDAELAFSAPKAAEKGVEPFPKMAKWCRD